MCKVTCFVYNNFVQKIYLMIDCCYAQQEFKCTIRLGVEKGRIFDTDGGN
jgi:hypothetical protein